MEVRSIVVALVLLAVLFVWYAWLEASERRRKGGENKRTPFNDTGDR